MMYTSRTAKRISHEPKYQGAGANVAPASVSFSCCIAPLPLGLVSAPEESSGIARHLRKVCGKTISRLTHCSLLAGQALHLATDFDMRSQAEMGVENPKEAGGYRPRASLNTSPLPPLDDAALTPQLAGGGVRGQGLKPMVPSSSL